jgi:hypothetical protein
MNLQALTGIPTRDTSNRAVAELRLKPHGFFLKPLFISAFLSPLSVLSHFLLYLVNGLVCFLLSRVLILPNQHARHISNLEPADQFSLNLVRMLCCWNPSGSHVFNFTQSAIKM